MLGEPWRSLRFEALFSQRTRGAWRVCILTTSGYQKAGGHAVSIEKLFLEQRWRISSTNPEDWITRTTPLLTRFYQMSGRNLRMWMRILAWESVTTLGQTDMFLRHVCSCIGASDIGWLRLLRDLWHRWRVKSQSFHRNFCSLSMSINSALLGRPRRRIRQFVIRGKGGPSETFPNNSTSSLLVYKKWGRDSLLQVLENSFKDLAGTKDQS